MEIPELLHSLTLAGLSLATEPDGRLSVIGPTKALTVEQRRALKEHSEPLLQLTSTCLTYEQTEREAIEFAETPEAQGLGQKVGNEFLEMASKAWETWFWNRIGNIETIERLDSFSDNFEQDILKFEVFRPIAANVRELIANRRALLEAREPHNQKTSEPGTDIPNPL